MTFCFSFYISFTSSSRAYVFMMIYLRKWCDDQAFFFIEHYSSCYRTGIYCRATCNFEIRNRNNYRVYDESTKDIECLIPNGYRYASYISCWCVIQYIIDDLQYHRQLAKTVSRFGDFLSLFWIFFFSKSCLTLSFNATGSTVWLRILVLIMWNLLGFFISVLMNAVKLTK